MSEMYAGSADGFFLYIGRLYWIRQKYGNEVVDAHLQPWKPTDHWVTVDMKLAAAYPDDYVTAATIQKIRGTSLIHDMKQEDTST